MKKRICLDGSRATRSTIKKKKNVGALGTRMAPSSSELRTIFDPDAVSRKSYGHISRGLSLYFFYLYH